MPKEFEGQFLSQSDLIDPVLPHIKSEDDTLQAVTPLNYHHDTSPSPPSRLVSEGLASPSTSAIRAFEMSQGRRKVREIEDGIEIIDNTPDSTPDSIRYDRSQTLSVGEEPMYMDQRKTNSSPDVNQLIHQARQDFEGQMPDFCVLEDDAQEIDVEFHNELTTKLVFIKWPDNPIYGYHMVIDSEGSSWIVKDQRDNGYWHPWLGAAGFHPEPIVYTLEQDHEGGKEVEEQPILRKRTIESVDAVEEVDEEQELAPKRNLRARKSVNINPYQADRIRHDTARKTGKVLKNEEVEKMLSTQKSPTKQKNSNAKVQIKHTKISTDMRSSSTDKSRQSTEDSLDNVDLEFIQNNTILRTRPADMPGAIPIKLQECSTLQTLLTVVEERWQWRLGGGEIYYLVAQFPWLDERANILLRPDIQESFDKMMDEIASASVWKKTRKCDVDIIIHMVEGY